jgi:glyoxylase-like metal-dependent hydrolase (beta-lactamase superfamily II)
MSPDLLQITPALYRLRVPGEGAHLLNTYLWLEADGTTLVDTGWPDSASLVESALVALGRSRGDVRRIVLTHFHDDHAGSAAEIAAWSGAEVVASVVEAPFIAGTARGPLPRLTPAEAAMHPGGDEPPHEPPHGPPCGVDRTVVDDDVLDFAGGARVIAAPGHTPGSIALHLPAADAVLTGDAVAEFHGDVILGAFNVDREQARRSLDRIAATGARIAGFGHGEAVLSDAHVRIRTATDPLGA